MIKRKIKKVEEPKVEEPKVEETFGNEIILSVNDIILNGKNIKEVKTINGQTYRVTEEEFKNKSK